MRKSNTIRGLSILNGGARIEIPQAVSV